MLNFTGIPLELHAAPTRFWEQFDAAIQNQNLPHPRTGLPPSISPDEFSVQLTRAFTASEFIAKMLKFNLILLFVSIVGIPMSSKSLKNQ